MTSQVLARKWRPKSFATLVGQEHVVRALSNALSQQRLHHAYMLTGTRGVGKTTIARILAKSLNCESGISATPCGECDACTQIDAGRFVDLLEIDAASNTGIDNIREVLDNAQYAPTQGRFKVYIIDEVHMLSKSAFNAMLKTLEEPPGHVKFILATTDPQKVPITVLSRCLQFSLRQMLPEQIGEHLRKVLDAEHIPYEPGSLALLGHAAAGSMRDALSLLDQAIAYGSGKIEESGVRTMLGAVDQSYLYELLDKLSRKDGTSLLLGATQLMTRGMGAEAVLQALASTLHQVAIAQTVPAALGDEVPHADQIRDLAKRFSPEAVQLYYQIALHGRRDLALAPDEYSGLSMALLRMLAFAPSNALPQAWHPGTATNNADASREVRPATDHTSDASPSVLSVDTPPPPWEAQEVSASPTSGVAPVSPTQSLDDWAGLVAAMRLGGQASMLAQHAVLDQRQGFVFHLSVPDTHKVVAAADYREKLEQALSQFIGSPARIQVSVGAATDATPAAQQQRDKRAGIERAEAAINDDPFVQTLIADFGAVIIPDTIQPRTDAS